MSQSTVRYCLAAFAALAGPAGLFAHPEPRELLDKLKAQRAAVENATFKATWEDLADGKLTAWEDQAFYWDNLQRRRLVYNHGPYDARGNRVTVPDRRTADTIYN